MSRRIKSLHIRLAIVILILFRLEISIGFWVAFLDFRVVLFGFVFLLILVLIPISQISFSVVDIICMRFISFLNIIKASKILSILLRLSSL